MAIGASLLTVAPASAATAAVDPVSVQRAAAVDPSSVQQAVDGSVAAAAADGIQQSIAVLDRATGEPVASSGGDRQYISESIVKLFTVAYYLVKADGRPEPATADRLRTMIIHSDDQIQSSLWNTDIVPAMAKRYGLAHTSNGPKTGPHDWGWELITADDEAEFLFKMSNDPQVATLLMDAMAEVAPVGSDGFDQSFGMNALTGEHGSKQGWTDVGSADQVQIHSVGWTDRYFVAILQTSASSDYDTMRADSTRAAKAVLAAGTSGAGAAGPTSEPPVADPTGPDTTGPHTAAPDPTATSSDPTTDPAPSDPTPSPIVSSSSSAAGQAPATAGAGPQLTAASPFSALLSVLWHGVGDAVADLLDVVRRW